MAIKKIVFKNLSATGVTYTSIGGIRFYDKNGVLYPSGSLLSGTSLSSETENFKLTATSAYSAAYAVFHSFNTAIVQTTLVNPNQYWLTASDNQTLTVEFKSVLNDISKIEFVLKPDSISDRAIDQPFTVEVLDENLTVIKSYSVTPVAGAGRNTVQTLLTTELSLKTKALILNGGEYKAYLENNAINPAIQPVSQFTFDEASGNVTDSKGTAVGTVTGATRVAGWNGTGSAMSFDGVDDYAQFNQKISPVGKKVYKFFIKTTANNQRILSHIISATENGEAIATFTDGTIWWRTFGGGSAFIDTKSMTAINDGAWHLVMLIWDGTTNTDGVKIFIDDMTVPDSSGTALRTETAAQTRNLTVGAAWSGSVYSGHFTGQLDELEIYNEDIIYKEGSWVSVSTGLPAEADFLSDGMDDLSTLNREVKLAKVTQMTDDGVLGAGKVFSASVDLSKYLDLRNVEIK